MKCCVLAANHVVRFTRPSGSVLHTASDQKLEPGKAWERGYCMSLIHLACLKSGVSFPTLMLCNAQSLTCMLSSSHSRGPTITQAYRYAIHAHRKQRSGIYIYIYACRVNNILPSISMNDPCSFHANNGASGSDVAAPSGDSLASFPGSHAREREH